MVDCEVDNCTRAKVKGGDGLFTRVCGQSSISAVVIEMVVAAEPKLKVLSKKGLGGQSEIRLRSGERRPPFPSTNHKFPLLDTHPSASEKRPSLTTQIVLCDHRSLRPCLVTIYYAGLDTPVANRDLPLPALVQSTIQCGRATSTSMASLRLVGRRSW